MMCKTTEVNHVLSGKVERGDTIADDLRRLRDDLQDQRTQLFERRACLWR